MGKFKSWICKVEGKEPIKPKAPSFFSPLPENIYRQSSLLEVINDVLEVGPGRSLEFGGDCYIPVDRAFEWASHEDEDIWSDFHSDGYVTEHIYNVCLSWDHQLGNDAGRRLTFDTPL